MITGAVVGCMTGCMGWEMLLIPTPCGFFFGPLGPLSPVPYLCGLLGGLAGGLAGCWAGGVEVLILPLLV